jgi:N-acetyl-anhydromuramyl-L-alanine amidase AmpD
MPTRRVRLPAWLVALLILLAPLAGLTVAVVDDGSRGGTTAPAARDFKRVDLPHIPASKDPVVDRDQQLEPDEQAEAAKSHADLAGNVDLHEDARDETPPGVPAGALQAGRAFEERQATTQLTNPAPPVGAQNYSCRAHPVGNQSALTQSRVGVALHFTVGGTIESVWRLFDTGSYGASSNYGISLTGRCEQWVPDGRKAWAQLAANSAYISIEITTNDLTRAQWLAAPVIKHGILASLVRDKLRAIGAPAKLVDPVGCNWTAGVTDHSRLECGNTHWDVGKNFPWDVFMRQVRSGSAKTPLTTAQKHACDLLNFHRRRAHKIGRWYPSRARRANELKKQIPSGRCLSKYRRQH